MTARTQGVALGCVPLGPLGLTIPARCGTDGTLNPCRCAPRRHRVETEAVPADANGLDKLPGTIKAAYCPRYGSPDVIELREIALPVLEENCVLIRIHAASLNAMDAGILKGKPFLVRLMFGLSRPKCSVPGRDVTGTVVAVGNGVTRFKTGDEVFGVCRGSCVEFACAKEAKLALKPKDVTFEQAATLGIAAVTALQAVRKGDLQSGQRVLINGAAGGVGTFSVQIAKAFGGVVTAVCGGNHVDLVRSLGADEVIDYSTTDFTQSGRRYDLIIDNAAGRSIADLKRVLTPEGRVVIAGAPRSTSMWRLIFHMLRPAVASRFGKQKFSLLMAKIDPDDMLALAKLVEEGKVNPAIERTYPLAEIREAFRYMLTGHVGGKLVIGV